MTSKDLSQDYPARILMLVPHEPTLDPRVDWVTRLCSEIGRTDVLGFTDETQKPVREYDQMIYTERVLYKNYSFPRHLSFLNEVAILLLYPRKLLEKILQPYYNLHHKIYLLAQSVPNGEKLIINKIRAAKARMGSKPDAFQVSAVEDAGNEVESPIATEISLSCEEKAGKSLLHSLRNAWYRFYTQKMIANILFQRAWASSIIPKLIICHDIQALEAGVKLKKKTNSYLLYDSHEVWMEADLAGTSFEKHLLKNREKRLIKHANAVITVAPQIAAHLEKTHGVQKVLTVPNAEPFRDSRYEDNAISLPVKFLLQGQVAPGRGYEEFLEGWERLNEPGILLILRCPDNPFLACLKRKFRHLIEQGKIVVAEPVKEMDLIRVARSADIGIIPYMGPNLNHVYACPNKLSQYMQAGLAILHNSDQQFVTDIVNHYSCGISYSLRDPNSLSAVITDLVKNPELIRKMKRNAYQAARAEFNWEVQSKVYYQVVKQLFES